MKIVIATSRAFHLVHLARELSLLGHEVTLMGYVPRMRMQKYGLGKASYMDLFWPVAPRATLALQRPFRQLCRSQTMQIMAPYDHQVVRRMPACDVFIGLSGVICQGFSAARQKYGALTLCERGSAHVTEQSRLISSDGAKRLPDTYILRELAGYETADWTVVPSRFAERTFLKQGFPQERLFRNMYGVDTTRFPLAVRQQRSTGAPIRALFVGAWSYQKGCDFLTEALEKMPDLEVTHAGQKVDLAFPDTPRFRSLGHVDNTRLKEIYASHDVLILPSRQDGFGMVLLEAFASGLPIVASRNTGAVDIKYLIKAKDRVQLMESLDVGGLIRGLQALLRTGGGSAPVPADDVQALTWQAYASRYADFLTECLAARHSSGFRTVDSK